MDPELIDQIQDDHAGDRRRREAKQHQWREQQKAARDLLSPSKAQCGQKVHVIGRMVHNMARP